MQGQQPLQYHNQHSGQIMQYPIYPTRFPVIPSLNPFLPTISPLQTQINEPRLQEQQNLTQPVQLIDQAAIQTVERPKPNATATRSIGNLLIPPKLAFLEINNCDRVKDQQTPHNRTDESEQDDFLDEIILGNTMPHLSPHQIDIETAQRTLQNRGYDLVKDLSVIKYKNSKWHNKLATKKPFTFRDYKDFWSDAGFSLEQINLLHCLSKECKSQSPNIKSRINESTRIYESEKEYAIDNGKE
ncbi:MAG: hypothetical protein EZS28_011434 [Streblomastix strix]|uniref:Uncharacterized protein n=1 Tax=Streblomastix strix TaxID=222440 RepID=A0A5J4WDM8_9EUKA|nr:MAG: hypothetical protein EZS28_011434 [Streblomastix strix]